ncbi:MAG: fatty acid desaturase [Candidatus Thiodiazotropha sp. (ex Dulcina madagascariensis)]|nr:fatty acid desaturase [Candidatus Thiodiazotropha sp. (ex Dulcina madagascariensis)]
MEKEKILENDERLQSIVWKDLLVLTKFEVFYELVISLPWLILSFLAVMEDIYILALAFSFMFFLTGLRQVHNASHYALGTSKAVTESVLFVLSILMLGSMHAVQINHLRHHKFFPDKNEDIEAISINMSPLGAILIGPIFPFLLHIKALKVGNEEQLRWIYFELLGNALWITIIFTLLEYTWLQYHVIAMSIGQCLTAFFAVWTVHHDCDPMEGVARTIRNKYKAVITYKMFYHLEHHLFAAVPTCHLDILAKRLDAAMPELSKKCVY